MTKNPNKINKLLWRRKMRKNEARRKKYRLKVSQKRKESAKDFSKNSCKSVDDIFKTIFD